MKWSWFLGPVAEGEEEKADGSRWRVNLIRAGTSKNGNHYSPDVLRSAVEAGIFEGVRAMARSDDEHVTNRNLATRNLAGWFKEVTFNPTSQSVEGVFEAEEPWVREKMLRAWDAGKTDYFGFSIVGEALGSLQRKAGKTVRNIQRLKAIKFVDLVVNPSAGGEILSLAESENPDGRTDLMDLEKLLKLIEAQAPDEYAKLDLDNVDVDQVLAIVEALVTKQNDDDASASEDKDKDKDRAAGKLDLTSLREAFKEAGEEVAEKAIAAERTAAGERLFKVVFAEAELPEGAEAHVRAALPSDEPWTDEKIREAIAGERRYVLRNRFVGPGSTHEAAIVEGGAAELDKWGAAMYGFFTQADERVEGDEKGPVIPRFISIKEAYISMTGDTRVTGQVADAPKVGLTAEAEIASGTFAGALGDAMHKAMQKAYSEAPYQDWRKISEVVPVGDFRSNYRPQTSGFPVLPTVAESGAYTDLAGTPLDTNPNYAVVKKGGKVDITLETIVNDDVGLVRRFPQQLGNAGQRTVSKLVWELLTTNSTMSDPSEAVFANSHAGDLTGLDNLSALSLGPAAIAEARQTMYKQYIADGASGTANVLALYPKYVCVGIAQEQAADELCYTPNKPLIDGTAGAGRENPSMPNYARKFNLEPIVIPHMTSATDWFCAASTDQIAMIEVGFLNGRDQVDLFVADMPDSYEMFNQDVIQYKARIVVGAAILDFRGFHGYIA